MQHFDVTLTNATRTKKSRTANSVVRDVLYNSVYKKNELSKEEREKIHAHNTALGFKWDEKKERYY